MKTRLPLSLALALALALSAALCCTTAIAGGMPDAFTDPVAAAEARVGTHRLMAAHLMEAGAIASGAKEFNGFWLHDRADSVEFMARSGLGFFFVPDSYEGTKAKASIAENREDFLARHVALETAATGLSQAVRTHSSHNAFTAMVKTIKTCNACHAEYMEPALILPVPGEH